MSKLYLATKCEEDDEYEDDDFVIRSPKKKRFKKLVIDDEAGDHSNDSDEAYKQLYGDPNGPVDDEDEEEILEDPSDLFDTESESEPEVDDYVYEDKPYVRCAFIDDEAEEEGASEHSKTMLAKDRDTDDEFEDFSEDSEEFEGDEANEDEIDKKIKRPMRLKDFREEEATEHNDLKELYGGGFDDESEFDPEKDLVGHGVGDFMSSDGEAFEISDDDMLSEESNSNLPKFSPEDVSDEEAEVIGYPSKRRSRSNARLIESDDESEVDGSSACKTSNYFAKVISITEIIDDPVCKMNGQLPPKVLGTDLTSKSKLTTKAYEQGESSGSDIEEVPFTFPAVSLAGRLTTQCETDEDERPASDEDATDCYTDEDERPIASTPLTDELVTPLFPGPSSSFSIPEIDSIVLAKGGPGRVAVSNGMTSSRSQSKKDEDVQEDEDSMSEEEPSEQEHGAGDGDGVDEEQEVKDEDEAGKEDSDEEDDEDEDENAEPITEITSTSKKATKLATASVSLVQELSYDILVDINCKELDINIVKGLVIKALGNRIKNADILPLQEVGHITRIGIVLDMDHSESVTVKGPPGDSAEAVEFRKFWGDLAELRRFKDSTVIECVHIETSTNYEKRRVVDILVQYVLKRHADLGADDVSIVGRDVDIQLNIENKLGYGTGEEAMARVVSSYDGLAKTLRSLKDLPLYVSGCQGISPVFRGAEVFVDNAQEIQYADRLAKIKHKAMCFDEGTICELGPFFKLYEGKITPFLICFHLNF